MLELGLGLACVAVVLGLWVLGSPWARGAEPGGGGAADARPLWWPWVRALAPGCALLATWHMRRRFERWQLRAGLPGYWDIGHWLAGRCLLAAVGFGWGIGLALLSGGPPHWGLALAALGAATGFSWPQYWLQRQAALRRQAMARELPFMLDLLTLCVEAGLSLPAALVQVAEHAPASPLRQSLRDCAALERTGMARTQWLARWADTADVAGLRSLVLALRQAEHLGMSLAPLLRAQAAQQRSERFLRAEKLALEAPVRMLFPMVLCIFPCTFLVIGFPVVVKLMASGL